MNARAWMLMGVLGVLGCRPSAPVDERSPGEQGAGPSSQGPGHDEHGEQHEDEPGHGEVPRRVRLDPQVREDAGIVTEPAEIRAIERTIRLPGEITADPDRRARVGARLTGLVESVAAREGERVAKGDVLAVIRSPDLQGLRAAEASLRARSTSARANAERLQGLVDKGMASAQQALGARAEADALSAEARAARERLRVFGGGGARRGPILYEVQAPRSGVVTERSVVVGDPVTPQSVIATIVTLDEVWFLAHVFERDVALAKEGSSASVVLNAYPDQAFEGVLTRISWQVDPGARTLSARIPLRNVDDRLRLGLFGTAFVTIGGHVDEPRLTVPRSAVIEVLGEPTVFVEQPDGHLERHEVVLGESNTTHVEIVHGLRPGERVVSHGTFSVKAVLLRSTMGEDHH